MDEILKLLKNLKNNKIENLDSLNHNLVFLGILKLRKYELLKDNKLNVIINNDEISKEILLLIISDPNTFYTLEDNSFRLSNENINNLKELYLQINNLSYIIQDNFYDMFFDNEEEITNFVKNHYNYYSNYIKNIELSDNFPSSLYKSNIIINIILKEKKYFLIEDIRHFDVENLKLLISSIDNNEYDYKFSYADNTLLEKIIKNKDSFTNIEMYKLLSLFVVNNIYKNSFDSNSTIMNNNLDYFIGLCSSLNMVPVCLVKSNCFRDELIKRKRIDLAIKCTLPKDIVNNEELIKLYAKELNIEVNEFREKLRTLFEYYKENNDILDTFIVEMFKDRNYTIPYIHYERIINDREIENLLINLNDKEILIIKNIMSRYNYEDYDISNMIVQIVKNIKNYQSLINSIDLNNLTDEDFKNLVMILQYNYYNVNNLNDLRNFSNNKNNILLNSNLDIYNLKNTILMNLCNINIKDANLINRKFCYTKKGESLIELIENEVPSNIYIVLKIINTILKTNSKDKLIEIFNHYRNSNIYNSEIPLEIYLRSVYTSLYNDKLTRLNDFSKDNSLSYLKNDVQVIVPRGEINYLVHCVGTCSEGTEISHNYEEDWNLRPQLRDHLLACSLINQNRLFDVRADNRIIFGMQELENGSLLYMDDTDIDSIGYYSKVYNSGHKYDSAGGLNHFYPPTLLLNNGLDNYNELVIDRRNGHINSKLKKRNPNCIIMMSNYDDLLDLENFLTDKFNFISKEDKDILLKSNNVEDFKKIITKYLEDICRYNNIDSSDINKRNEVANYYLKNIKRCKYEMEYIRAAKEFNIPLIIINRLYYFKEMLNKSEIYTEEEKEELVMLFTKRKNSRDIWNMVKHGTDYDSIINNIMPKRKSSITVMT